MFDIGFSELVVIALVALIVIGPERLPRVARTAGHLMGRLQRYVNTVKSDISREIALEDLKNLRTEVETSARDLETSLSREMRAVEQSLSDTVAAGTDASVPLPAATADLSPPASPVPAPDVLASSPKHPA